MNSHIEIIGKDLIAVNFQYVDLGYIKEMHFIETPGKTLKKVVTITEDGYFVINKMLTTKIINRLSQQSRQS